MGGLVTSHKAGLAVPDWPNSYGYNMFLFPPSYWVGGIFFEHTHRLLGTLAGFCSILLLLQAYAPARNPRPRKFIAAAAILSLLAAAAVGVTMLAKGATDPLSHPDAARLSHYFTGLLSLAAILIAAWFPRTRELRPWVRRLTIAILLAVIFQGILGGLRVVWVNLNLAVIHGCFAQAFFCLCTLLTLATSKWWHATPSPHPQSAIRSPQSLTRLALASVLLVYLQLIAGATMRHFDAGLAIPDLPLAYGQLLPPTSPDALPAINEARSADALLHPVTLTQIWLHFAHRIGAVLVTAILLVLISQTLRRSKDNALRRPAHALSILLLAQLTLGVLTVLWRKPAEIATSHVAVGALLLVTTFVIFVRSARLYGNGKNAIITTPTPDDPVRTGAIPA
jgi:cytochrome c oxidase assembly protein subunit 15